jgi:iron(III) transport system substrate-binding protein
MLFSVAALLVSVFASACATPAAAPQVVRETVVVPATVIVEATSEAAQTAAAPAGTGSLVVYSGRSESLVGPIIEQFRQATGIDVQVKYGSTAEIAATLLEEGANSPADVFFAQDPGGLGAVANAGLFATLPEELTAEVKEQFRSPDGKWVGVSGRARVVVYNTEELAPEDLPEDIFDFALPEWKDKIGWAPTNASLHAMITAMRVTWGEEKTREWIEGILANNPRAYEGNAQVVEGVANGEVQVGFVNHYYLYRFLREHGEAFTARNQFLTGGGPGSLVMVAGVGELASAKNKENAERFIQFLLSPVAQQYFVGQTFEYPVVEGVVVQRGLAPLEELNALDISMTELEDLQGTLKLLQDTGVLQ